MKANYESGDSSCLGITKYPSGNDYMLVYRYDELNDNLSKTFGEVTWKYKIDEWVNKLLDSLNELINKGYSKTTDLLNELLESLKTIKDCTNCKNKKIYDLDEFHESINKIENCLARLEKEEQGKKKYDIIINELNKELFRTDSELNEKILCEDCYVEKEIKKLTEKCENEKIARFIYECKLNAKYYDDYYVRWIPFDEFENTKYLAKGSFGEVHKATWNNYYDITIGEYVEDDIVLKRIYNSSDNIVDILNEVMLIYYYPKQNFV